MKFIGDLFSMRHFYNNYDYVFNKTIVVVSSHIYSIYFIDEMLVYFHQQATAVVEK